MFPFQWILPNLPVTPHLLVPQSPMFQVPFGLPHPRPLQTQPLPLSVVSHSVYVRQIAFPVSDTTTTIYNVSVPAVVQPSEIHSSTLPFGDSPSSVFSTFVPPNQATTRVQVRPPTSARPCGPLHRQPPSQTGFIIPQGKIACLQHYKYECSMYFIHVFYLYSTGTEFGMMLPDTSSTIHAVCVLTSRTQMHGRSVAQGNVVVEVLRVLNPALHPIFPGAFDEEEPVCVGGFYEWPCSQLKFMNHD